MKILTAILAASLCAAPVMAQETGSLINRGRTAGANGRTANDARGMMLGFAACVTGRSPGRVKNMLSMPMSDPRYDRIHDSLFVEYNDCLSGSDVVQQLRMSNTALRGAIYEALYRREYPKSGPSDFAALAKIDYAAGYARPIDGKYYTSIALGGFGDCVARRDPADARSLLLSAAGSGEEKRHLGALTPNLGPCLPSGQQLTFSSTILRGAIAEGLYRLSAAAAPVKS